jgi:hypothetical protein
MTEEKHNDCEMCVLAQKLGHSSCTQLTNEMINECLDVIHKKDDDFFVLAKSKFEAGEISKEEFIKLGGHSSHAMGYAAATIAASMAFDGPKLPPEVIIETVSKRLGEIMLNLLTSKSGASILETIPANILKTLEMLGIKVDAEGGLGLGLPKNKEMDPKLN